MENRKEKIKKWEEEIEDILRRQKELVLKSNARIRELRKKIQETEEELLSENNRMIATAVREIFGEVTGENLGEVKEYLKLMKSHDAGEMHPAQEE